MRRQSTAKFMSAAVFLSAMGMGLGNIPAFAAQEATDVALVEDVSGRAVAFSRGKPTLLGALDTINDGTQLDVPANSELRVCHYQARKVLTLKGPLRASISRDSVIVENGKLILASAGTCSAPVVSNFQGGLVVRGLGAVPVNDVPGKR